MSMKKSVRFAVFDRDNFTCRYCGRSTDDQITLEVDHVIPKSKGGGDEMENLVTSCCECNRGKSAKTIGQTAPETDRDRLRRLQEIAEANKSAKELMALSAAKKKRLKAWEGIICDAMSLPEVDRKFCEQADRLSEEFGDAAVVQWINKLPSKFYRMDNNSAKYLNGIARNVRSSK